MHASHLDTASFPDDVAPSQRAVSAVTLWAAFAFATFLSFSRLSYGFLLPAIRVTGMLRRTVTPALHTASLGVLTASVALGQAIAPVVGGVRVDHAG